MRQMKNEQIKPGLVFKKPKMQLIHRHTEEAVRVNTCLKKTEEKEIDQTAEN